ncbi:energy transducer TonB [Hymenobacter sp. ASUV-10]|uniref:Energy transducer TonB n=1 Tax=Hymenobacter aranciens TaxID=3063996 RepID=A0ABT9B978_9BACT|nr:energy transducer TonB [Hymenobacter sp. ASUV-10]MDO7874821.1 energy transducer TonB [Hymenobacter sp. ASUV-10]
MKNPTLAGLSLLLTCAAFPGMAQKLYTSEWESGILEKKTKVGVWEYFSYTPSKRQVVVQRYDHTANKLVYYRPISETYYNIEVRPGQWTRRLVDQPPLYIGGDPALANYTTKLNYPSAAQERNIQGRVIISFTLDTLGHATNHKVLRGIGGGCDEEAMRVARTIPDQWIPARVGPRAVPVEYELPLTFRLAAP